MIYLIRGAAFVDKNDKTCTEFEVNLKIGYVNEKGVKARFNVYITENPTSQVLYLIPLGTMQDESNLHAYFGKYLKYGREWFSEEQEILDFFETHTTKESLRELNYLDKNLREEVENKYIDKILSSLVSDYKLYITTKDKLYNDLDHILSTVDPSEYIIYFKSLYPEVNFSETIVLNKKNKDYKFIVSFKKEFEKDKNFERRMKMYCELLNEHEDIYTRNLKIFKTIIPTVYQSYMNLLGPDRIKAISYIESDIKNECSVVLGKERLRPELLMKFHTGKKYTTKYIKSELAEIYNRLGLKKTAKASDLNEWFDIKVCTILNNNTGKWDRGFEILGLKKKEEIGCQ